MNILGVYKQAGDSDSLMHRDIIFKMIFILIRNELLEAHSSEAAFTANDRLPVSKVLEKSPGQTALGLKIIRHAHQAARTIRRAGCDKTPLKQDSFPQA